MLLANEPATLLALAVKISVLEPDAGIVAGLNVQVTALPAPTAGEVAGAPIVPAPDVLW